MGSKDQTRWADNDKGCKMRKHISIRVNSRIPVQIILIINQIQRLTYKIHTLDSCLQILNSALFGE